MSKFLIFVLLGAMSACTQGRQEPSDDYVLIEFASKLEENYDKLEKTPTK